MAQVHSAQTKYCGFPIAVLSNPGSGQKRCPEAKKGGHRNGSNMGSCIMQSVSEQAELAETV